MSKKLIIKQCKKCMATVRVIQENGCEIMCCGEAMQQLVPNTVDAAFEKHVPTYEVKGDTIMVKVNHVMEEDHYIEWISMCTDNKEYTVYLKPGEVAEAEFPYVPKAKLYAYCNKHSLWENEVE